MASTKFAVTEFMLLNDMLGGGIPIGKIIEIFGYEGCGKSTLGMELTKYFKRVYYIDFEHELDMDYAKMIGANITKIIQPATIEEGCDTFFHDYKEKRYDLLIVDTIGAGISAEELENDLADNDMGISARKITRFVKKMEHILKPLGTTTILLNHKKDILGKSSFGGEKHYTPGGRYLRFAASFRLSVTKKSTKVYEDAIICNIWSKKDKVTHVDGIHNAEYMIRRGKGIIRGDECLHLALAMGMITHKGQCYHLASKSLRGIKEAIDFLDANPKVREAINARWNKSDKRPQLPVPAED